MSTMQKMHIPALIERVRGLTGADRETDARIWCYIRGVKYADHFKAYSPYDGDNHLTQVVFTIPPKRKTQVSGNIVYPHAEPVTASVDAAISLAERVLPGCWLKICTLGQVWLHSPISSGGNPRWFGEAKTAPLAIIVAILTALQSEGR